MSTRKERDEATRRQRKWDEVYTLLGLALALGSWGYSAISPEPNFYFGSLLLAAAFVLVGIGVCRAFDLRLGQTTAVTMLMLAVFVFFDWYVIVEPQRGLPFRQLLVSGYHLTDECNNRSAAEPIPEWLHNQMTAWYAQVEQLVGQKLDYKNLQQWRGAVVVGLVSDSNLSAYQCTQLSVKVEALETIISTNYDPKLGHQEYQGPLYWLESADGKVDISEALKHGGSRLTIHKAGTGAVVLTGKVPQPKQP